MKKVTEEIKESMKKLRDEGMTYKKIGESLGLAESTIQYHLKPGYKEKTIKRSIEYKKEWKGRAKYMKEYMGDRYNNDEEFRERVKKHSREYQRRKRGK